MTAHPSAEPKRILVVDDDVEYNRLVLHKLRSDGYEARAVESGERAIELMEDFRPHLIILDLMMPTMTGHELVFHLQENHGNIPVIVASAVLNDDQKEKIRFWGSVREFLRKPFDLKDLTAAIGRQLGTSGGAAG